MIPVTIEARDFVEIKARLTLYEIWRAGRLSWSDVAEPEWAPTDDERTALAVYEFVSSLPNATMVLAGDVEARGKAKARKRA